MWRSHGTRALLYAARSVTPAGGVSSAASSEVSAPGSVMAVTSPGLRRCLVLQSVVAAGVFVDDT